MPSYAVLGATGNTGTALIQILLRSPEARIHAYCRNSAKLAQLVPEAATSSRIDIFEGGIQDTAQLASCIRGCHAVFLVISTNDNVPGCRIGQELATSVIQALESLKYRQTLPSDKRPVPKLVLLSSAAIDDHLCRNMPYLRRRILLWASSNVYDDLRKTEAILRAEQSWIKTIFIKPGALSADAQRGHALSFDHMSSPLSYLDLAASMIEAVDESSGRYDMRNVGVANVNGAAAWPPGIFGHLMAGLLTHFFPYIHTYLPKMGAN